MQEAACTARQQITLVGEGPCSNQGEETNLVQVDGGHEVSLHLERSTSSCPSFCSLQYEPVCANNGQTYSNPCQLRSEACRSAKQLEVVHAGACGGEGGIFGEEVQGGDDGVAGEGVGVPGGLDSEEVLEAAEEGVRQLAKRRGEGWHYTLDYVESAKTQVTQTGHPYLGRWWPVLTTSSPCWWASLTAPWTSTTPRRAAPSLTRTPSETQHVPKPLPVAPTAHFLRRGS